MKKILCLLIALTVPLLGATQTSRSIVSAYNVTNTSYTFPLIAVNATAGTGNATTVGSSTTVSAVSGTPFSVLSAGDLVNFSGCTTGSGNACSRVVGTPGGASIVVDTAININTTAFPTGVTFTWQKLADGATSVSGFISTTGQTSKTLWWQVDAIAATSIEGKIECSGAGPYALPNVVWPAPGGAVNLCGGGNGSVTAAPFKCGVFIGEPWARCRLGLKVTGDVGTQSITAGYESLTVN